MQDANDPPDNMVFNFIVGFTAFDVCVAPYTPIYTIQGSGLSTPIPGNVRTKGVVVGDFEGSSGQQGFYMQDLSGDGDPATSDGIFVFTGSSNLVSAGQLVSVTGVAGEDSIRHRSRAAQSPPLFQRRTSLTVDLAVCQRPM